MIGIGGNRSSKMGIPALRRERGPGPETNNVPREPWRGRPTFTWSSAPEIGQQGRNRFLGEIDGFSLRPSSPSHRPGNERLQLRLKDLPGLQRNPT